jgi:hypothetical protein
MIARHTPGPWNIRPKCGGQIDSPKGHLATVYTHGANDADFDECTANARLVASAPELLHVLERILYAHDTHGTGAAMGEAILCRAYAEMARHAIAKARGLDT